MNIYLIRHGRQDSALLNDNVSLSKEGREQAELLGERLKKYYKLDALYSSDYIRAIETAEIINKYFGFEHKIDARFREVNLGALTGLSDNEVKQKYGDFLAVRATMTVDKPYPGGGETCQQVYERVYAGIMDIINSGYKEVCIVMHGGAIRALLTGLLGAKYAKWLIFGRQIENCSITQLFYDENMKTFHIERFNDYAHLEGKDYLLRKNFSHGFFDKDN